MRFARSCSPFVAFAAISTLASASLRAAVVVAPNANAATLGNGQNTNVFGNPGDTDGNRYQQVYTAAANFAAFAPVEAISQIAFRAKQAPLGSFIGNSVTISNVNIKLSTTSKTDTVGLDATLGNNPGADALTVYSGPLTLTTAAGGTTAIDYVINLQTPFVYSKALGNLLLDVTVPNGSTITSNGSIGYAALDTVTDAFPSADGTSSAFGSSAATTVGANSTTGYVTRFTTVVPEPATAGLITLSALALAARSRRGR